MGNVNYTDNTSSDDFGGVESGSLLDELLGQDEVLQRKTIRLEVDSRPGNWVVEFDDFLSSQTLKRAKNFGTDGEDLDGVAVNAFILGERNKGIYRNVGGSLQLVPDKDGKPLTFRSLEFVRKFSSTTNPDRTEAVIKFLGEPLTMAMGDKLTKFAGWNKSAVEAAADPSIG